MRVLLEQYFKDGKDVHIHLSRDFHLSGRVTSVGEGVISLSRGNSVYHIPIDKIVYIYEQTKPKASSGD
jgi:sRNA-binding regulator protein Hfq